MRTAHKSFYQYGWKSAEGTRERERGGERGREQLEKEKERQDGHKRRLPLRQGPFLGVGRVDLPPPTCRRTATLDARRTGMSGNGGNLQKS